MANHKDYESPTHNSDIFIILFLFFNAFLCFIIFDLLGYLTQAIVL